MKVSITKKGYTISEISGEQLQVVMDILERVTDTCFKNDNEEDLISGKVPSGDGFTMLLGFNELADLFGFKAEVWICISRILNKK